MIGTTGAAQNRIVHAAEPPAEMRPSKRRRTEGAYSGDSIAHVSGALERTAPTVEEMFNAGSLWKHLHASSAERKRAFYRFADHPAVEGNAVHMMSTANIHRLETELNRLAPIEQNFVAAAVKAPWFLTHATSESGLKEAIAEDGSLTLKSRAMLLRQKKIRQDHGNTPLRDQKSMHGTDFVYSGVEIGPDIQKPCSRFGTKFVRFPLDGKLEQRAISLPDDQFIANGRVTKTLSTSMLDAIGAGEREVGAFSGRRLTSRSFTGEIFSGIDIKRGLALQAVKDFRGAGATPLLATTNSEDINCIINSIGRPQVLVPKMIRLRKDDYTAHAFRLPQSEQHNVTSSAISVTEKIVQIEVAKSIFPSEGHAQLLHNPFVDIRD